MSGYFVKIGTATRIWGSRKDATVALPTCQSEYYSMTLAAKECFWMKPVLSEGNEMISSPVPLLSDRRPAIKWATGEHC